MKYYISKGTFYAVPQQSSELYHYGVKGMKWGKRKNVYDINAAYYNKRAGKLDARAQRNKTMASMNRAAANSGYGLISKANRVNANYYQKRADKLSVKADRNRTMANLNSQASKRQAEQKADRAEKAKKAVKIGAVVAGTALAAYGAYKLDKALKNKAYSVAHKRGVEAASKYMSVYKNNGTDAARKAGNIGRYLSEQNHDYAKRSSKSTAAAVKTLLGKNREMPVAELWNMGINTPRYR